MAVVPLPFFESFEDYPVGYLPVGPWKTLAVAASITDADAHRGSKSMMVSGGPYACKSGVVDLGTDFSDVIIYQAWVKVPVAGRGARIGFMEQIISMAPVFNAIWFHPNGYLYFHSHDYNANINVPLDVQYNVGSWDHIRVELDFSALTGDIYFNGDIIGDDIQISPRDAANEWPAGTVNYFPLRRIGAYSFPGDDVYIDDFYVQEGMTIDHGIPFLYPPVEVEVNRGRYQIGFIKHIDPKDPDNVDTNRTQKVVLDEQGEVVGNREILEKVFFTDFVYKPSYPDQVFLGPINFPEYYQDWEKFLHNLNLSDAVLFVRDAASRALMEATLAALTGGASVTETVKRTSLKIAEKTALGLARSVATDPVGYLKGQTRGVLSGAIDSLKRAESVFESTKGGTLSYQDALKIHRGVATGMSYGVQSKILLAQLTLQQGGGGDLMSQLEKISLSMADQLVMDVASLYKSAAPLVTVGVVGLNIVEFLRANVPVYGEYLERLEKTRKVYNDYKGSLEWKQVIEPSIKYNQALAKAHSEKVGGELSGEKNLESQQRVQKTETSKSTTEKHELSELAVVKGNTVYPNKVDKKVFGGYKYNLKNPEHVALALVEGINNGDLYLLKSLAGGKEEVYATLKQSPEKELLDGKKITSYEVFDISQGSNNSGQTIIKIRLEGESQPRRLCIGWKQLKNGYLEVWGLSL